MTRWWRIGAALTLAAVSLLAAGSATGCGAGEPAGQATLASRRLLILAPAPMKKLLDPAAQRFHQSHPAIKVTVSYGHVPSLFAQIEQGVGADVLLTPDAATMAQAKSKGWLTGDPKVVARDELALVVPADNRAGVRDVSALADRKLRVAVCAPQLPCGQLAQKLAQKDRIAIAADTLEAGGSPGVVTKAAAGEIDVGLAFASDAAAGGSRVAKVGIPLGQNVFADVSVATLRKAPHPDAARPFIALLTSEEGVGLARQVGYTAP